MINCEGCISKQKEIDDLKLEYDKLTDWASEYKAENAKLRDAIKLIDSSNDDMFYYNSDINNIIRQVLKEVDEK